MFEAMDAEETTILGEECTFLDRHSTLSSRADYYYNTGSPTAWSKLDIVLSMAIYERYPYN